MFTAQLITIADRVSSGISIFKPLYLLFGYCMKGLLFLFNDRYFLALVVFTILTRVVLFPFNLSQQKKTAKTSRIQPKIQKIQKKYNVNNISDPNQRRKAQAQMNEEMQALYAREGHNPMNMGCGPMAFQMIFLMGIIGIIYYPLQYILGASGIGDADTASKILEVIKPIYAELSGVAADDVRITYFQLNIIENFDAYREALTSNFPGIFNESLCSSIDVYRSGLTLFNIDMTAVPHWKDGIIVAVPVLCLITSLASSVVSTLIQRKTNPAMAQQNQQMLLMMLMMPLFSFYIAFRVPAAVGIYWIISNLVALVQQLVMAKFFPPKKNIAREMIENTIERRSREESMKKISN